MQDPDFQLNDRLRLAFDYVYYTGRNVFLTGKAGTGKTTFLKRLRSTCPKRMIVTSPTGVAAVNAGGVTLHSFFQLPLGPRTPDSPLDQKKGLNSRKIQVIRSLELLVIDEISMVRADLLDSVDLVLRRYRRNGKPFGGVQLLLIGDMQQLSPVIKQEDEDILRPYYQSFYFFGSQAWRRTSYVCIELDQVFRQTDGEFVTILNKIREGSADGETLSRLNRRCIPGYRPPNGEDVVTLVTTNRQADTINQTHLLALDTPGRTFDAEVKGDFPEASFPVDRGLTLKRGTLVMFLKNDTSQDHMFYNGKIGRVSGFDDDAVYVKCKGEDNEIRVLPMEWTNTKYEVSPETKEIKETAIGTFRQIPLRVAWAVTIHKSQGLTFDRLMIDASNSFAHGQVYVALSRCRTLEGLVLLRPLSQHDIISDPQVRSFAQMVEQNMPDNTVLRADKRDYFFDTVAELFDFNPLYNDITTMQRHLAMYASSVVGDINAFDGLASIVMAQMMAVSEKFVQAIRHSYGEAADLEAEATLLQRIQNGCAYYLEKMKAMLEQPIKDFAFDSDDKARKSRLIDDYNTLTYDFDLKKNILDHMKDGFSIKRYLVRKAEVALELSQDQTPERTTLARVRPGSSRAVASSNVSKNPALYDALSKWREQKAAMQGARPADIISTRTLRDISDNMPVTTKELVAMRGMKGNKGKAYAVEILKIVHANTNPDAGTLYDQAAELRAAEYEGLGTAEKSLWLFKEGKSVDQIVSERKLKAETILGHLAKYVATGEIDPYKILPEAAIEKIRMYILEKPGSTDKQIVEGVRGCKYGDVAIVRAMMESALYD